MLDLYESFAKSEIPQKFENEIFDDDGKITILNNLNKVNIFLGSNNSGKSHFIRELLRREKLNYYYSDNKLNELRKFLIEKLGDLEFFLNSHGANDINFILRNPGNTNAFGAHCSIDSIKSVPLEVANPKIEEIITQLGSFKSAYSTLDESQINNSRIYNNRSEFYQLTNISLYDFISQISIKLTFISNHLKEFLLQGKNGISRIYIPSTRTLRAFAKKMDVEKETRAEYSFASFIFIENGQNLCSEIHKLKNSYESKERRRITDFEVFLSHYFFHSSKIELIAPSSESTLYIKIGDEKDQPIHNLGDGLQMIILLTFPFFLFNSGLIAIEEPELFIHPGLQKQFIDFLLNHEKTKQFQIYISTHSNHIIDSVNTCDKISLFNIRKKYKENDTSNEKLPDFVINNVAYGNDNIFSSLGISNSSVYLANCMIWVEGVTDRLYINKYIKEYFESKEIVEVHKIFQNFQEGIHFSYAYTGGDSIIHWDFDDNSNYSDDSIKIITRKFCGKALVVVDNDFKKNTHRKKVLKQLLGDRLIELNVPEIENLLHQDVVKKVIKEYPSCAKINLPELPDIKESVFKQYKIGKIIDQHILNNHKNVKKFTNPSGSGSLRAQDKVGFCLKSLKYINKDTLSIESIKLVKRIIDFIIRQNNYVN